MTKLLWEWKPRLVVALVVCGLLIVMSHINCDVTSYPVVMHRYANTNGDEQRYKMSKTQVFIAFHKMVIVVEQKMTTYTVCAVVVGTSAVSESSTNHSSIDRIVVNFSD